MRTLLMKRLRSCESRSALAKSLGISGGSLSKMLSGRHLPSKRVLAALGLVAVVDYRLQSELSSNATQPKKSTRLFRYGDWPVARSKEGRR